MSVGDRSQVCHGAQAVVVILGPEFMPIDLRMACEGHELASLSWCDRKSLILLSHLYTFCLFVCQSLPNIDVNARPRSNDKSLATALEAKKSRIFSTRKLVLSWSRFGVNLALNGKYKFGCKMIKKANYVRHICFCDDDSIEHVTLRLWKSTNCSSRHPAVIAGNDIM